MSDVRRTVGLWELQRRSSGFCSCLPPICPPGSMASGAISSSCRWWPRGTCRIKGTFAMISVQTLVVRHLVHPCSMWVGVCFNRSFVLITSILIFLWLGSHEPQGEERKWLYFFLVFLMVRESALMLWDIARLMAFNEWISQSFRAWVPKPPGYNAWWSEVELM